MVLEHWASKSHYGEISRADKNILISSFYHSVKDFALSPVDFCSISLCSRTNNRKPSKFLLSSRNERGKENFLCQWFCVTDIMKFHFGQRDNSILFRILFHLQIICLCSLKIPTLFPSLKGCSIVPDCTILLKEERTGKCNYELVSSNLALMQRLDV